MRAIVQRVSEASVSIDGKCVGSIQEGIMVLVGMSASDTPKDMVYIANKITGLRIFEDAQGKMNLSVKDKEGGMLIVPNFTLYGDVTKGMRPSFIASGSVHEAKVKYEAFLEVLKESQVPFETGEFQADMQVTLINDGPVTILLDSSKLF